MRRRSRTTWVEGDAVVIEPATGGLPPLRPYLKALWRNREFGVYLAWTELKVRHINTWLGQLWTVLNPFLLGLVYYFVIGVLRGNLSGGLAQLDFLLSGLFAFYFTRNSLSMGASSIVGSGKMLLNTTIPRAVMPASAVTSALLLYVPALAVYFGFHAIAGGPWSPALALIPGLVVVHAALNLGLALGLSAMTVYVRDVASFLPYLLRIWLYLSPVLYLIDEVPARMRWVLYVNPLTPLLTAWHEILGQGRFPEWWTLIAACLWALAALVLGGWFFISKEREFALRI